MTTASVHGDGDSEVFISFTKKEWRRTANARLRDLGLTYEELQQQAKDQNFVSTAARKLWIFIGGTL